MMPSPPRPTTPFMSWGWAKFVILTIMLLAMLSQVLEINIQMKDVHVPAYAAEQLSKISCGEIQIGYATDDKPRESLEEYLDTTLKSVNIKSEPLPADYKGHIDPIWTCGNRMNSLQRKVIFVHVYKTAGSTFRTFFDTYGQKCHKGTSVVIECNAVSVSSMTSSYSTPWASASGKKCINKHTKDRDTGSLIASESDVTGSFLQKNTDIMIGHLPIGVHAHWPDSTGKTIDAQYLVFFREPVAKYVSGRLFANSVAHWTFDEAVSEVKQRILTARASNEYYDTYRYYLLTPEQKEFSPLAGTIGGEIPLIKQNLIENNALVGIVERMGESLALMQSILDVDAEITGDFQALDLHAPTNTTEGSEQPVIANKSVLSTGDIVKALQADKEFYPKMVEYLKHEFDLYDYALRMHKKQVEQMRQQHGKRYYFP